METAILIIAFNRPDTTSQLINALRTIKPRKIYVAADGPRDDHPTDRDNCSQVRLLIDNFGFECELHTLYQEKNLGCRNAVETALDWFFENEESGIILEDDIIPSSEFCYFMENLLIKYSSNDNVAAITGFNPMGQFLKSDSYFFYRGFYPWGWATWKRFWTKHRSTKYDMNDLKDFSQKRPECKHLHSVIKFNLNLINKGHLDTWDYQLLYTITKYDLIVAMPEANLTVNIGYNGAHSNNNNMNHSYGKMNINNLIHPNIPDVNNKWNNLLLEEYSKVKNINLIKTGLLYMGFYGITKKIYRRLNIFLRIMKNE
jgi:hypothetical protein